MRQYALQGAEGAPITLCALGFAEVELQILVSDIKRKQCEDRAARRSSEGRFSTCSLLGAAWRVSHARLDADDQTIDNWRRQERVERGEMPDCEHCREGRARDSEQADSQAQGLPSHRPPTGQVVGRGNQPKSHYTAVEMIAAENRSVQTACLGAGRHTRPGFMSTTTGNHWKVISATQC